MLNYACATSAVSIKMLHNSHKDVIYQLPTQTKMANNAYMNFRSAIYNDTDQPVRSLLIDWIFEYHRICYRQYFMLTRSVIRVFTTRCIDEPFLLSPPIGAWLTYKMASSSYYITVVPFEVMSWIIINSLHAEGEFSRWQTADSFLSQKTGVDISCKWQFAFLSKKTGVDISYKWKFAWNDQAYFLEK